MIIITAAAFSFFLRIGFNRRSNPIFWFINIFQHFLYLLMSFVVVVVVNNVAVVAVIVIVLAVVVAVVGVIVVAIAVGVDVLAAFYPTFKKRSSVAPQTAFWHGTKIAAISP